MKTHVAVLLLLLAVCIVPGLAQKTTPFITIGDHRIELGDPAQRTLSTLRQSYFLQVVDEKTRIQDWIVSADKDSMPIAGVYINTKTDSVIGIEHLVIEREDSSAQAVFDGLFQSADKFSNQNKNTCTLTTGTAYDPNPGLSKASIFFDCGAYKLRLQRNEFKDVKGKAISAYMVWESLGLTDD